MKFEHLIYCDLDGESIKVQSAEHPKAKAGVGFDNSEAPTVSSGGRPMISRPLTDAVEEKALTFQDFARREQLVASFQWTTAQGRNSDIFAASLPFDVLNSQTIKTGFERFVYWIGDVHVRILVQSNSFQQGMLLASHAPLSTSDEVIADTLVDKSVLPNLQIRAGTTSSKTLVVPYCQVYEAMTKTADIPLSLFRLTVFNQLRTTPDATAPQQVADVSVFVSFPDAKFKVIDPVLSNTISANFDSRGLIKVQGGVASKVTNINVDHVSGGMVDVSSMADAMESKQKGSVGGLDRPNIGVNYTPLRQMKYPDLANGKNIDYCNVLKLDPGGCAELHPREVATTVDENDMKYLTTKWTWDSTVEIANNTPVGSILAYGPLTCAPKLRAALGGDVIQPSLMEYCSIPWALWRGSLKYKFEFIVSKIHVMRVAFVTHYGGTHNESNLANSFGQYAQVFDISAEQNTFEVEVPYRAPTAWLDVPHGSGPLSDQTMGEWSLRIVNPLVVTETVAQSIDMNIYLCSGDDFELKFYGGGDADVTPFLGGVVPSRTDDGDIKVQSQELVGDPAPDTAADDATEQTVVAPNDSSTVLTDGSWRSIRDCLKRSAALNSDPTGISSGAIKISDIMVGTNGPIAYYSKLYRCWKGPVRFRVFGDQAKIMMYAPQDIDEANFSGLISPFRSQMSGTVPVQQTNATVGVIDAQVPFITKYNFCLIPRPNKIFASHYYDPGSAYISSEPISPETPKTVTPIVYAAAGDTFRMAYVMGVPRMSVFSGPSALYNHAGSITVPVPGSIWVTTGATHKSNITQNDINFHCTSSNPANPSFSLSTAGFSKDDYTRILGITFKPYEVPVRTLPQVTVQDDLSDASFLADLTTVQWDGNVQSTYNRYNVVSVPDSPPIGQYDVGHGPRNYGTTFSVNFSDNSSHFDGLAKLLGKSPPSAGARVVPDFTPATVQVPCGLTFPWENLTLGPWDGLVGSAFVIP